MSKISIRYNGSRFSKAQNDVIKQALERAVHDHGNQKRASGDPFVLHPIAVAEIVAEWGMDHETIAAALLHDVVEDTPTTLGELQAEFGERIALMVDGVTKLRLSASPRLAADSNRRPASSENLRKLLLASTKDVRVLLLKLADRLHNLRTLGYLPEAKRRLIALESLEVFAPLADRLGMGMLKGEMEDMGFRYAMPEEYASLERVVSLPARKAEQELALLKRLIQEKLTASGLKVLRIEARRKHSYSVYKKLAKVEGDISKIYDLVAVRVILPEVADCYQALGVIHQSYKPLIHRIKDYIAVPKPNGYQSLHTTVFGLHGRITEIQIRTQQMHEEAEYGLAAHFFYDQQKLSKANARRGGVQAVPEHLRWVQQLNQLKRSAGSLQEFDDRARLELFADQIYVFSPKGDLYELPEGATPLDFAFAVHSNLGLRALGARVNGRIAGLDSRLENRDVVEILARREAAPNRDWLGFVVTAHAKNRIRSWFRAASRETNVAVGRQLLEQALAVWDVKRVESLSKRTVAEALDALHLRDLDELYVQVAEGGLPATQVIRRLIPDAAKPANAPVVKRHEPTGRVLVKGKDLAYTLAPCCRPVFPQPLVGYITRGKGVTVHVLGCRNLPGDTERLVACGWETTEQVREQLRCGLEVAALNRLGLVSDITGVIAARKYNLAGITSRPARDYQSSHITQIRLGVEVPDLFALTELIRQLIHIPGVQAVKRVPGPID